ncbi:hypothetical protein ZEAMMB73_Zm00001d050085 [Zea mays]|uniref:Uncharacterized protein n=1 Tax=Zea mays TaxID=4577 RepID=A0A1D6PZP5_MAIZE|nr:hypothetical protein ZEAMMB73_Zm00001d050085 [Zea mays]
MAASMTSPDFLAVGAVLGKPTMLVGSGREDLPSPSRSLASPPSASRSTTFSLARASSALAPVTITDISLAADDKTDELFAKISLRLGPPYCLLQFPSLLVSTILPSSVSFTLGVLDSRLGGTHCDRFDPSSSAAVHSLHGSIARLERETLVPVFLFIPHFSEFSSPSPSIESKEAEPAEKGRFDFPVGCLGSRRDAAKFVSVLLPKSTIKFERYLMDEILSIDADVSEVEFGKKTCFVPRQRLPKFDLHLQVAATKKGGRYGDDAGAQPPGMYGIDLGTIVGLELDVDIVATNATTKKEDSPDLFTNEEKIDEVESMDIGLLLTRLLSMVKLTYHISNELSGQ